ncbi:hypothetical protein PSMK_17710 [Phycisphaera mikurensis NBRC 102666]|uniref:DUF3987 domain-containing protein n=1 Tax=Phycisphaera mikurensis (strain NBRC 102666 / KCTC 22515 / FYK2301M01) TaxID=1142394 RepID=I0IF92_PHYMF|nr:hypothetical protein PSMK_17710 [Phycisphaera mikurensis NBRC 102666]
MCGKPDWCARMGNGSRVKCERLAAPPPGWKLLAAKDGGGVFAADDAPPEATTGTWMPAKRPQAAAPLETGDAGENRPGGYGTAAELVKAAYGQRGPAAGRWTYRDAAEKPVGVVLRFEEAGGRKTYRQASRCPVDGLWRAEAMPKPRPLYRLPELLAANPSLPVDVLEGEKAADAGAEAGLVTVTAAGGSGAPVDATDWKALRGRCVRVLADHDDPGRKWAARVADHLGDVAADVRVVHLVDRWADLPPRGDLVDALEREADPGAVRAAVEALAAEAEPAGTPEPRPLPPPLLAVPPFDPAWLPEAFRLWCLDVADRMQCPLDYVAVAALVTFSGAVGARLCIRPKGDDTTWEEIPNLWGGVVGSPGTMKTPAMKEPKRMLERLEKRARKSNAEAEAAYELKVTTFKAKRAAAEAVLKKAAAGDDAEAMAEAERLLGEVEPPAAPTPRRYVVNDATPEKLHAIMEHNPAGVTLLRDELPGWLAGLEKKGREQERALCLEAWNGDGCLSLDRIRRGEVYVDRMCLSVCGAIQPEPMAALVAAVAAGGTRADGFLDRLQAMTWPDHPAEWRDVDRKPDRVAFARAEAAYERAATTDPARLGGRVDENAPADAIPHLRFCGDALERFRAWRHVLEARLPRERSPMMSGWLSKLRKLVPSLALLLHVADATEPAAVADPHRVTDDALRRALELAAYFEAHARRVLLSETREAVERAGRILERLEAGDLPERFSGRDVYAKGWSGIGRKAEPVTRALELLRDHGHLLEQEVPTTAKGGAPSVSYAWRRPRPLPEEKPRTKLTQPPAARGSVGSVSGSRTGGGGATPEPPTPGIGEGVEL